MRKKSKLLSGRYPCHQEDCTSSDGVRKWEDGSAFCFVCSHFYAKGEYNSDTPMVEEEKTAPTITKVSVESRIEQIKKLPIRGNMTRKISMAVAEFFGFRSEVGANGQVVKEYYPYPGGYWKERVTSTKRFTLISEAGGLPDKLCGQDKFNPGGKRLVITEGEWDMAAVAEASLHKYGKIYPVVSLASATGTTAAIKQREWIRSFQEVIICVDEDEAGERARSALLKIVGLDKAKITKLSRKDAGDVLKFDGPVDLLSAIFDAGKVIPSGIMSKEKLWDSLVEYNSKQSMPYPDCIRGLNTKLKGTRSGEITLFVSGTSSGKSTLTREVILGVLESSDDKVGIVSLEESPAETARKFAGMKLERNPAKEEIPLDELKPGFDAMFGDDRVLILDHQGSISDDSIIDKLEYMCLWGATHIIIDHITILVSEGTENLRGNEAQDKIMNDLLRLVKRHPVWIGLVSHLRKSPFGAKSFEDGRMPSLDDIKGSGSIKQVSFDIVAFARNLYASSEDEKNTIFMRVLKSRFSGLTGDVPGSKYVYDTGRLEYSSRTYEDDGGFQVESSDPY